MTASFLGYNPEFGQIPAFYPVFVAKSENWISVNTFPAVNRFSLFWVIS